LHPLPRVEELSYEIDITQRQAYFKQVSFGIPLRMALLSLILGKV
jgi:aspartate carbamoyltransferase catalytic subunit